MLRSTWHRLRNTEQQHQKQLRLDKGLHCYRSKSETSTATTRTSTHSSPRHGLGNSISAYLSDRAPEVHRWTADNPAGLKREEGTRRSKGAQEE